MRPYAGTGTLVRLALRRDRLLIPLWALVLAASVAGSASATAKLYPDEASREKAARLIGSSPATAFMYGPIHDPRSQGELGTFKMVTLGAVFVSLLGMFLVRRHTRADEESGRLEMVTAGVLGKRAALAAAVVVGASAVLLACVLTAVANIGVGMQVGGSLAFGGAWAAAGLFFVACTAVAAQLTQSARACAGVVAAVLGTAYVLRGLADTSHAALQGLRWLSPIGWTTLVRPYAGDRWWVLLVPAVVCSLLLGVAFTLQERRDLGEGLIPTRSGPARASASLSSALGLAWRLQRGTFVGWAVAMALLGLVLGSLVTNVAGMLTPQTRRFLEKMGGTGAVQDVFLSVELAFLALGMSVYAIAALSRMAAEESAGHAEVVLATTVPRGRWLAGHVTIAVLGSAALVLLLALSAGLSLGAQAHDVGGALGKVVPAALAQLPAAWVLAAVTAALYGVSRRLAVAGWGALVVCLLLGQLGEVIGLPGPAIGVSPFSHTPKAPAEAITAMPLLWLTVVTAALLGVAFWRFRHRDVG